MCRVLSGVDVLYSTAQVNVKLTDHGISRTGGLALRVEGTAGFIAPEVLSHRGHEPYGPKVCTDHTWLKSNNINLKYIILTACVVCRIILPFLMCGNQKIDSIAPSNLLFKNSDVDDLFYQGLHCFGFLVSFCISMQISVLFHGLPAIPGRCLCVWNVPLRDNGYGEAVLCHE